VRSLALRWLAEQRRMPAPEFWPELRFDVVGVLRERGGAATVRHLRGAF
jgi:hypothetical protein